MSVPYEPGFTARLLAGMSDAQLAAVTPRSFQRWPAPRPLPVRVGQQLIDNERATRAAGSGRAPPSGGFL